MKKLLAALTLTVLLINIASAFTFINIFVDETGEAIFLGETSEDLNLPSGISNNNGEISGLTSILTNKQGETWDFSYSLPNSEMTLFLPENSLIKEISNGEITISDDRISIFFQDQIDVSYTIEKNPDPINSTEIPPYTVPILIVLIAIAAIIVVYFANFSKRETEKKKQKERERLKAIAKSKVKAEEQDKLAILHQVLSEREKIIVNKLKEVGKVKSSQLRKLCDIPKASFSRHIQELEKKGLIKRTGEGKNKFVELVRK